MQMEKVILFYWSILSSYTALQRSRGTVSANRADRQHVPWKQSLRFVSKVGRHWFNGNKLYLCTTAEGIIFSHVWTTANRNDAAVAPEWLASLCYASFRVFTLVLQRHLFMFIFLCFLNNIWMNEK
ncbi:hypothetical protein A7K69_18680 [Parageobacillus thermoglucosidasius]|uniref:Uncharacterized protein n=1 Tax=Parageobacillus thermoglucosidasius TaxID=1426 RepID=A0A1B7KSP1_PARTM|nr:hypothetical protein A7K69_18680 [Parageobacillus thermoglucosidasius]